jgi:hypothetical protein
MNKQIKRTFGVYRWSDDALVGTFTATTSRLRVAFSTTGHTSLGVGSDQLKAVQSEYIHFCNCNRLRAIEHYAAEVETVSLG